MTNPIPHGQEPEALRLAQELDAVPETGADPQTIQEAAAELRRQHAENEALQAGYAAARLEIESLQDRIKAMAEEHADELMVAHLDGMRAAQEPVGWLYDWVSDSGTVRDWFSQDYEEAHSPTNQCHNIRPLYTHPAPQQPAQAAQGDALSDDAVRVPLDSLHADAAYLIGRLREGSMPYARAIEIIRERIDAAKTAIRARAARVDVLDAARLEFEMQHGSAIAAARKQGGQKMTHKEPPKQVHVGWLVETTGDPMLFAVEQRDEALLYCEDGAEPVAIYCNKPELERHTTAQEGNSHD